MYRNNKNLTTIVRAHRTKNYRLVLLGYAFGQNLGGFYYPPRRLTRFIDPEQGVGMT